MKPVIPKSVAFLALTLGFMLAPQPTINANTEIVTALLRGPAAYLEYELRNDTSRSAHAKKALIASIRFINDLYNPQTSLHKFGWFIYDARQILLHLKALRSAQNQSGQLTQNSAEQNLSDDKDYQILRRFVLPAIEMLGALGRTEFGQDNMLDYVTFSSIQINVTSITNITITMSRLGQLYFAAPKNSTDRKIIIAILTCCLIEILSTIEQRPPMPQNLFNDICPICGEAEFTKPSALTCGHIFCKNCIRTWLTQKQTCPSCRQQTTGKLFRVAQHEIPQAQKK